MKSLLTAAALATAFSASFASAAEITGGKVNLTYSRFTDSPGGATLSKTSLDASTEIGFNKNIGMQVDLGTQAYGASGLTGYNLALHGQYHLNDKATLGAFVGQDTLSSANASFTGLEFGIENNSMSFQAFAMSDLESDSSAKLVGLHADYDINGFWQVTGNLVSGNYGGSDANLSLYSIGVRYETGNNFALTADLGAARGDAFGVSSTETFLALGGELTFGAERGTTFGKRSLISTIPGF
ncbi:MAG: hypothetical protein ACU0A6_09655 [Shimia sp.]|uniref:hypothetical protein n=1 Tax=Shimia sp. TaxID=1954381 RepID=UPI004059E781